MERDAIQIPGFGFDDDDDDGPPKLAPTGNTSIFGLISKVNKGILKQPPKSILKPASSSAVTAVDNPSMQQALAVAERLSSMPKFNMLQQQKHSAFMAAKSRIEQIQLGLWKEPPGEQSSLAATPPSTGRTAGEKPINLQNLGRPGLGYIAEHAPKPVITPSANTPPYSSYPLTTQSIMSNYTPSTPHASSNYSSNTAVLNVRSNNPPSSQNVMSNYPLSTQNVKSNYPSSTQSVKSNYALSTQSVKSNYALSTQSVKSNYPSSTQSVKSNLTSGSQNVKSNYPPSSQTAKPNYPLSTKTVKPNYPSSTKTVKPNYPSSTKTVKPNYPPSSQTAKPNYPPSSQTAKPNYPSSTHNVKSNYSSSTHNVNLNSSSGSPAQGGFKQPLPVKPSATVGLVDYDEDVVEGPGKKNNISRESALKEIDKYMARPYKAKPAYPVKTSSVQSKKTAESKSNKEPFKNDFDRYFYGNASQKSEIRLRNDNTMDKDLGSKSKEASPKPNPSRGDSNAKDNTASPGDSYRGLSYKDSLVQETDAYTVNLKSGIQKTKSDDSNLYMGDYEAYLKDRNIKLLSGDDKVGQLSYSGDDKKTYSPSDSYEYGQSPNITSSLDSYQYTSIGTHQTKGSSSDKNKTGTGEYQNYSADSGRSKNLDVGINDGGVDRLSYKDARRGHGGYADGERGPTDGRDSAHSGAGVKDFKRGSRDDSFGQDRRTDTRGKDGDSFSSGSKYRDDHHYDREGRVEGSQKGDSKMPKSNEKGEQLYEDFLFGTSGVDPHAGKSVQIEHGRGVDGIDLGRRDGVDLGRRDVVDLGRRDGVDLGRKDGVDLGRRDGIDLGRRDGVDLGRRDGVDHGRRDGVDLERRVGVDLGRRDGLDLGRRDGVDLGRRDEVDRSRRDGVEHGRGGRPDGGRRGGLDHGRRNGVKHRDENYSRTPDIREDRDRLEDRYRRVDQDYARDVTSGDYVDQGFDDYSKDRHSMHDNLRTGRSDDYDRGRVPDKGRDKLNEETKKRGESDPSKLSGSDRRRTRSPQSLSSRDGSTSSKGREKDKSGHRADVREERSSRRDSRTILRDDRDPKDSKHIISDNRDDAGKGDRRAILRDDRNMGIGSSAVLRDDRDVGIDRDILREGRVEFMDNQEMRGDGSFFPDDRCIAREEDRAILRYDRNFGVRNDLNERDNLYVYNDNSDVLSDGRYVFQDEREIVGGVRDFRQTSDGSDIILDGQEIIRDGRYALDAGDIRRSSEERDIIVDDGNILLDNRAIVCHDRDIIDQRRLDDDGRRSRGDVRRSRDYERVGYDDRWSRDDDRRSRDADRRTSEVDGKSKDVDQRARDVKDIAHDRALRDDDKRSRDNDRRSRDDERVGYDDRGSRDDDRGSRDGERRSRDDDRGSRDDDRRSRDNDRGSRDDDRRSRDADRRTSDVDVKSKDDDQRARDDKDIAQHNIDLMGDDSDYWRPVNEGDAKAAAIEPAFHCKDCNITCIDKEVYDFHLQSDGHVLTLQKKAAELFQMKESGGRKSRFDKDTTGNPILVMVPTGVPTTMITGIHTNTSSAPGLRIGQNVFRNDIPLDSPPRRERSRSPHRDLRFINRPSSGIQVIPPKPFGPLEPLSMSTTRVTLQWKKLTPIEEEMIEMYVIEYRNARETHWVRVGQTSDHIYGVDGLQENTDYLFRVQSVNGAEKSEVLESVLITTRRRRDSPSRTSSRSTERRERKSSRDRDRDRRSVRDRRSSRDRDSKYDDKDKARKPSRDFDKDKIYGEIKNKKPVIVNAKRQEKRLGQKQSKKAKKREIWESKQIIIAQKQEVRKKAEAEKKAEKKAENEKAQKAEEDRLVLKSAMDTYFGGIRTRAERKAEEDAKDGEKEKETKEKASVDGEGKEEKSKKELDVNVPQKEPVDPQEMECLLYGEFNKINDSPMLGLDHIYEIVSYKPTTPARYLCKLCNNKGSLHIMIKHLMGFPHKLEFFKTHDTTIYEAVSMMVSKKSQIDRLDYEGQLVEDKIGRGAVKVMKMLNPADTGNKVKFETTPVKAPPLTRAKVSEPQPVATVVESQFPKVFSEALEKGFVTDADKALIGLTYIKETFHPRMEKPPKYVCSLCHCICGQNTIVYHMIGKKHRMAYIKVHQPDVFKMLSSSKDHKKLLNGYAIQMELKDGPGEMKLQVHRNDRLWRHDNELKERDEAKMIEEQIGKNEEQTNEETQTKQYDQMETEPVVEKKVEEENQSIKFQFGIKKPEAQSTNVNPVNVLEQGKKGKEPFDWNKENGILQSKIQNQTIIKCTRKSKFITVYSEFFKRYPVIGLQWVTEFQKPDPKLEPWYMCFMCQQRLLWKNILDHVTCNIHRLNYMKKNYKEKYKSLYKVISTNKTKARASIEEYSRQIVQTEGTVTQMEVMLELNINTEALKTVMKVKENLRSTATATATEGRNIVATTASPSLVTLATSTSAIVTTLSQFPVSVAPSAVVTSYQGTSLQTTFSTQGTPFMSAGQTHFQTPVSLQQQQQMPPGLTSLASADLSGSGFANVTAGYQNVNVTRSFSTVTSAFPNISIPPPGIGQAGQQGNVSLLPPQMIQNQFSQSVPSQVMQMPMVAGHGPPPVGSYSQSNMQPGSLRPMMNPAGPSFRPMMTTAGPMMSAAPSLPGSRPPPWQPRSLTNQMRFPQPGFQQRQIQPSPRYMAPYGQQQTSQAQPVMSNFSKQPSIGQIIEKQAEQALTKQILARGMFPPPGTKVELDLGDNKNTSGKNDKNTDGKKVDDNETLNQKGSNRNQGNLQPQKGEKRWNSKNDNFESNKRPKLEPNAQFKSQESSSFGAKGGRFKDSENLGNQDKNLGRNRNSDNRGFRDEKRGSYNNRFGNRGHRGNSRGPFRGSDRGQYSNTFNRNSNQGRNDWPSSYKGHDNRVSNFPSETPACEESFIDAEPVTPERVVRRVSLRGSPVMFDFHRDQEDSNYVEISDESLYSDRDEEDRVRRDFVNSPTEFDIPLSPDQLENLLQRYNDRDDIDDDVARDFRDNRSQERVYDDFDRGREDFDNDKVRDRYYDDNDRFVEVDVDRYGNESNWREGDEFGGRRERSDERMGDDFIDNRRDDRHDDSRQRERYRDDRLHDDDGSRDSLERREVYDTGDRDNFERTRVEDYIPHDEEYHRRESNVQDFRDERYDRRSPDDLGHERYRDLEGSRSRSYGDDSIYNRHGDEEDHDRHGNKRRYDDPDNEFRGHRSRDQFRSEIRGRGHDDRGHSESSERSSRGGDLERRPRSDRGGSLPDDSGRVVHVNDRFPDPSQEEIDMLMRRADPTLRRDPEGDRLAPIDDINNNGPQVRGPPGDAGFPRGGRGRGGRGFRGGGRGPRGGGNFPRGRGGHPRGR